MGMSIGDSIKALLTERKTALHENKKAFDFAVDTMRKYQQIEQIYSDYLDDMDEEKLADKLGEVF